MKSKIKKVILNTIATCLLLCSISCNSWLDLLPSNDQTSDMYWESKAEVEAVLASAYKQLRSCLEYMVYWGELRGDGVDYSGTAANASNIKSLNILPTNGFCNWSSFYTSIGYANSVIKYGESVLEKDPTFTQTELNGLEAEAIFIRSLAYFYLVRTFGEVPLVLEPYVDDSEKYVVAKSTEERIITQLINDLEANIAKCRTGYESDDPDSWMNTGRINRFAFHALLADIYLWNEDYDKCIDHCDELIKSGKYRLLDGEDWYRLYYPGNSVESIYELPYNNRLDGTGNSLNSYFYGDGSATTPFLVGSSTVELFTEYTTRDLRGPGASYIENTLKIWKYSGTNTTINGGTVRGSSEYCNWIIYRYAEILLFKAEALVMSGDIQGGYDIIVDEIRARAGYTSSIPYPESQYDALLMVINERQMELVAEGKRWFDILRVAKRNNYQYKDYLITVLLANVSAKYYAEYRSKLQDVNSYYLPIYKNEIENGEGVLVQNPYYANLD